MGNIYSVRIIRSNKQAISGVYLKEFWMLCGVYVREHIIDGEEWQKDDLTQNVDCNICCSVIPKNGKADMSGTLEVKFETDEKIVNNEKLRKEALGKSLKDLLENMGEGLQWDEEMKREFEKIRDVFVNCDYAYNQYKYHLFVCQMEDRSKMFMTYKECLNQLSEKDESLGSGQYIQYAYLNCARKYERVCAEDQKLGHFNEEWLMKKAYELAQRDAAYTSAKMLAGLIGLSYQPLWNDGIKYLEEAIKIEASKKNGAFMRYILGHFYEWQKRNPQSAWREYEKIEEIDKDYYKMLYKKAYKEMKNRRLQEAEPIFNEIYNRMKKLAESGYIQPAEIEYYYKSAAFLRFHGKLKENELDQIRDTVFDNSEFIKGFFDEADREACKKMLIASMENKGKYCR